MKKIYIEKMQEKNDRYIATNSEGTHIDPSSSLKDGGRMLVDSDAISFIYIVEDDQQLYYIYFPRHTWEGLSDVHKARKKLELYLNEERSIELKEICNELDFLIENIDGNGNYGEEMELAVQEVFR